MVYKGSKKKHLHCCYNVDYCIRHWAAFQCLFLYPIMITVAFICIFLCSIESRLLKAMKEGCVHVKYSKFSLSGPPGSGKSSLTDLLNNEKPLLTHNSTPVLTEPSIRQVRLRQKGGGEGRNKWNKVGLEDLKVMAAKALSLIEPDADTQQANTQQYTTQSSHATTPSHSSIPSPNGSSESSSASAVGKKALGYQSVSNLLIFRFIPALAEVHWIYGVDSGGQAAFLDIAPALLHHNSLNILVHKLNESLDDQPQFFFSVDGDTVGKPIKRQMTHLQFLHSSIRSLASVPSCSIPTGFASTNAHASGSVFLVLGTFLDKIGRQSLVEKNKVLWSEFEEYIKKGVVKAYKEGEESIIYPVVTTDRGDEAQAIAEEIRSAIREHYIEASVPIRWFLFQHELKKAHDSTSIIAKSEAVKIGASLGMDSEDVEAALQYYHDLTIILYFPSVLPHVVFLHPQPLFNKLSDLISVSFTDTAVGLKKMKTNRSIPDGSHVILKQEGKFNRKLLECLPEGFTEDFTVAHFLSLMESLLIIAPVDEGQYFIPCVLETCSIDEVKKLREGYSQDCDPFVVSWDGKIVPQGMYPALVVNLLKRGFTLVKKQIPYRNAIKLHSIDLGVKILLVDTIKWLEIHCAGPVEEACPVLNGFIHDAIKSVSSKFCYNSDTEDGTLCSVCPAGVCRPNKARTHITCTNDDCFPRKIGERQSCWFNGK